MRRHQPGARALSTLLRAGVALAAGIGSALVILSAAPMPAGASGIVPPANPSVSVPPQVMPACSFTTVDDTSAGCIDSVLHNINYARSLEGLGPLVLPSDYASDPVAEQQLILTDEERGDRGLSQFDGLDAALNTVAQAGAVGSRDPVPPLGYLYTSAGSIFAQDYTPLGADFAWMYDDGYGGTNLDCTAQGGGGCWGHRDNILGPWTTTGTTPITTQTAMMGDGNTSSGQYAEIFANQVNPADPLVDTITPASLPTPSSPAPPDVVQVLPASSPNTGAGTPVTIEGNYFTASPTPQVFFGGVPATNVHVNWNGELTADAPADPAGTATDQVIVTVSTMGGSSSATGTPAVNEFTYAPTTAPTITSVSPSSGPEVPTGQRDDPRHELLRRGSDADRRLRVGREHRLHELQLDPDHDHHPARHQRWHRQHHGDHACGHRARSRRPTSTPTPSRPSRAPTTPRSRPAPTRSTSRQPALRS